DARTPIQPPAREPQVLLHDLTAELLWPRALRTPALALRPGRVLLGMAAVFLATLIGNLSGLWTEEGTPTFADAIATPIGGSLQTAAGAVADLDANGFIRAVRSLVLLPGFLITERPLDTALLGEGRITGPLTMPAYQSDPETLFCYSQDVAKAKALMAEAGKADGFSATVIVATGEPPTAASEAQVLQAQLKEIGINLDIKMMELNVYVDTWLKGDFDMAVALNGGRSDPYTMYNRYWTKAGNLQKVANYIDDTL
ncbi:ABC transporter substrate-binding protein, partial [Nodularia spumigena]|uniref:ABC transporter substrate-binding protein n=1 Tax=Nodularia spumigena TaxID=70799 RepID=UPI002B1FE2EA